MAQEIERKYLLANESWRDSHPVGVAYQQGYLMSTAEKTVRIRIAGDRGYVTIKSGSQAGEIGRAEYEYEIPLCDAQEMFDTLCEPGKIEKTRYNIPYENHVWEVDVFQGANQGLITAEIELTAEDESFSVPSWIGQEVTHDKRYQNGRLAQEPYTTWK